MLVLSVGTSWWCWGVWCNFRLLLALGRKNRLNWVLLVPAWESTNTESGYLLLSCYSLLGFQSGSVIASCLLFMMNSCLSREKQQESALSPPSGKFRVSKVLCPGMGAFACNLHHLEAEVEGSLAEANHSKVMETLPEKQIKIKRLGHGSSDKLGNCGP